MPGQLASKEAQSLPDGNATFQQKGPDLVDDAGALAHQPLSHAVHRLKVQLIDGLGRDELHGRALHRFGNGLRVTEVVLLSLRIGTIILRWHQPGVVVKAIELAAEMMRADAGFHADQAWRHVGKAGLDLAT